jgi:hypothetical protein
MIRLTISKEGTQKITEVCDKCDCHVRNLTVSDILVKGDTDMKIFDENGKEVTRKEHPHQTCRCTDCDHD